MSSGSGNRPSGSGLLVFQRRPMHATPPPPSGEKAVAVKQSMGQKIKEVLVCVRVKVDRGAVGKASSVLAESWSCLIVGAEKRVWHAKVGSFGNRCAPAENARSVGLLRDGGAFGGGACLCWKYILGFRIGVSAHSCPLRTPRAGTLLYRLQALLGGRARVRKTFVQVYTRAFCIAPLALMHMVVFPAAALCL